MTTVPTKVPSLDFFELGESIPVVKMVPPETYMAINDHTIRNAIVYVLRKGILHEDVARRRYVLNINEIVTEINALRQQKKLPPHLQGLRESKVVKKTALYHHRDVLVELDLIREVASVLEGKRYVTYYARTARAFIADSQDATKLDAYNEFVRTSAKAIKPKSSDVELDLMLQAMTDARLAAHQAIVLWLEEHVDIINANDLDALQLYEFLMYIHPKMTEGDFLPKWQNMFDL